MSVCTDLIKSRIGPYFYLFKMKTINACELLIHFKNLIKIGFQNTGLKPLNQAIQQENVPSTKEQCAAHPINLIGNLKKEKINLTKFRNPRMK